jgi:hypothetical protein
LPKNSGNAPGKSLQQKNKNVNRRYALSRFWSDRVKLLRLMPEPSRAQIGSTGSLPPNRKRRAPAGSKMAAQCSPPESDAFAASIGLGSTVKA